ncbi:FapA family protein [Bacillus sp. DTU_2020_1000418_1_SI_GHA_SEK_038]|uniref:DUF342 domain-containing protein n=1 Tax=Bacillus sp. DTU_2020_1000418_1_SI_GHA_SEK_038 TaxID=3077585 RepID=UPI0028ED2519|nr:FapA family protein [Bacillus sp. DTU_2020_1000418_1_SI_GHA_SEK_038]WNS77200.1 FapA family protein [Bacillus sp. DTU_2020_1000418_1_SI_GHA_SEK_038]
MEKHYRIIITKDRLTAKIDLVSNVANDFSIKKSDVEQFLSKEKISFGIIEDVINQIFENPQSLSYPSIIAEGIPPKNGVDAYLLNEVQHEKKEVREKFNFRKVLQIPSVSSGQPLASVVPPTPGTDGMDVFGKRIPAKNGNPLKIRPGKNVILNNSRFYSTSDGQLSLTDKMISVNPVFEVNGDLDLKTGNVDFIGNVVIRGNVPSGYEIKAGGDVRIFGLVEAAHIHAEGNIIISGGVTGGNKGMISSVGNVQATYLNQANVQAGHDVIIESSILHSKIRAGSSILGKNAFVIGGFLTANKEIHVKEVGNHLFTKTELQAHLDTSLADREKELHLERAKLIDNLEKLSNIERKLLGIAKLTGNLTQEQKVVILKQKSTKQHIVGQITNIDEELRQLEEALNERQDSSIYIYETVFPNSTLRFGKYAKQLQHKQSSARFLLQGGEIVTEPIL